MKAVELLRSIKSDVIDGELYLKSLDGDLVNYLVENKYTSTQTRSVETLLEFEFGEDAEVVFEWLYNTHNTEIYNLTAQQLIDTLSQKWKDTNEQYGG
jgi:hypothetical protein